MNREKSYSVESVAVKDKHQTHVMNVQNIVSVKLNGNTFVFPLSDPLPDVPEAIKTKLFSLFSLQQGKSRFVLQFSILKNTWSSSFCIAKKMLSLLASLSIKMQLEHLTVQKNSLIINEENTKENHITMSCLCM